MQVRYPTLDKIKQMRDFDRAMHIALLRHKDGIASINDVFHACAILNYPAITTWDKLSPIFGEFPAQVMYANRFIVFKSIESYAQFQHIMESFHAEK